VSETLRFLWLAYKGYVAAKEHGSSYSAVTVHGIPQVCLFIGIGREAWRISQRAIQEAR
jgi:hypothetical protein